MLRKISTYIRPILDRTRAGNVLTHLPASEPDQRDGPGAEARAERQARPSMIQSRYRPRLPGLLLRTANDMCDFLFLLSDRLVSATLLCFVTGRSIALSLGFLTQVPEFLRCGKFSDVSFCGIGLSNHLV